LFINSPGLFADFHALHRLLMPRHLHLGIYSTFSQRSSRYRSPSRFPSTTKRP
jgi:hypothetical protein